jgi:hypothetical protein
VTTKEQPLPVRLGTVRVDVNVVRPRVLAVLLEMAVAV